MFWLKLFPLRLQDANLLKSRGPLFYPRSNPMKVKEHYVYERKEWTEWTLALNYIQGNRQREIVLFLHWIFFFCKNLQYHNSMITLSLDVEGYITLKGNGNNGLHEKVMNIATTWIKLSKIEKVPRGIRGEIYQNKSEYTNSGHYYPSISDCFDKTYYSWTFNSIMIDTNIPTCGQLPVRGHYLVISALLQVKSYTGSILITLNKSVIFFSFDVPTIEEIYFARANLIFLLAL